MHSRQRREPSSPTPQSVARRSLILSVVYCRGMLEPKAATPATSGLAALMSRSHDWLNSLGLSDDLTKWERRLVTTPVGNLSQRDAINASWLCEAVAVLAWSLGRCELPALDEQCDGAGVVKSLGFLQPRENTVLAAPSLRPTDELLDYNKVIWEVQWRIRDFELHRNTRDFESIARKAWGEPVRRHGLRFAGQDICVAGQPLSRAKEEDRRTLQGISQERHRASNWLIGGGSTDFYHVTIDT